jgi:hypothetical protein
MAAQNVQNFLMTLTGAAQAVTVSLNGGRIREIHLQPDPANVNPFYVGGPDVATTTGQYVRAPSASVPPPPYVIDGFADGTMRSDDWYVIGTLNEKVRVMVVPYI